jgi:hypothetical protein
MPCKTTPNYALISDEKVEYYRNRVKECPGGLACIGWSCVPRVELIAHIDALRTENEQLKNAV